MIYESLYDENPNTNPNTDEENIDFGSFGGNSLEENEKLAEKLIETGFESLKDKKDLPVSEASEASEASETSNIWKDRYFKLLEVLNTFKKEEN